MHTIIKVVLGISIGFTKASKAFKTAFDEQSLVWYPQATAFLKETAAALTNPETIALAAELKFEVNGVKETSKAVLASRQSVKDAAISLKKTALMAVWMFQAGNLGTFTPKGKTCSDGFESMDDLMKRGRQQLQA